MRPVAICRERLGHLTKKIRGITMIKDKKTPLEYVRYAAINVRPNGIDNKIFCLWFSEKYSIMFKMIIALVVKRCAKRV